MANFDDDFLFDDDDNEADADITSGYVDDEPEVLSFEEQDRRQKAFEVEVNKRRLMLRKPKNYPAKERIAAAYWLGEAGDPQAIPELVLVYNRDKTKGMKEAAAYSLGMFKALKEALDDPEMQSVVDETVERIVMQGKYGKRYNASALMLPQIGLAVLFVVLLMVGFLVGQLFGETPEERAFRFETETAAVPTPTEDTLEFALADLTTYYSNLNDDARVLQGQMAIVTRGASQDCSITFTDPPSYTLSQARQADPNLPEITAQLNTLRIELVPVRNAFRDACETFTAIPRNQGLELAQIVINVQAGLREVEALLFGEEVGIEAPPTLELTAAPEVSPTPEPTIDFAIIRPHYDTLSNIIIDMIAPVRGGATRQEIYWQNILDFGSSEGCEQPAIIVPEDYVLPADLAAEFPALASATSNVNTGLQLMRDSVATFPGACQSGEVADVANVGLSKTQLAIQAFNDAQANLDEIEP